MNQASSKNVRKMIFGVLSFVPVISALAWQTPVGPAPMPTFDDMERSTNATIQAEALHLSEEGALRSLSLSATGTENAFPSLSASPPTWMFSREWNAVRLTVRGVSEADETVTVRFGPNPAMIILR